jgi:glycosyltransferase involved in cell wall biosynthesis
MSMAVADFIPTDLPLVVGTRQIAAHEERGRRRVTVIEPPVDLGTNNPDAAVDVEGFRRSHGIPQGLHVVVVCRLARELKLEGLLVAIEQVPRLSTDAVLTVVGDGPARPVVEAAAEQANAAAGRRAVVLTGEVADPRPAYAMADVALGMGGSALRALAFGAPLVVQGESGFWAALTADSLPQFQWTGWYGVGAGPRTGPDRLSEALAPLLHDARLRTERAQLALQVAQEHYSLARAAVAQEELYRAAAEEGRGSFVGTADLVGAGRFIAYQNHQRRARRAGRQHRDDFNGRPVAGTYSANATADADGRQSAVPR